MKKEKPNAQKLIFISLLFFFLLNFPFLALFNKPVLLGGFPLLYVYLFLVWSLLIVATAFTINSRSN